jgi:hypothetical protein
MRRIVFVLLLAGCNTPYLSDDEGGGNDHALSTPYALGTKVVISGHHAQPGWLLKSDAPGVLQFDPTAPQLGSDGVLQLQAQAVGEGDARVHLLDENGREVVAATATVLAADSARLFSHGDLRILGNDSSANYNTAEVTDGGRILAGGKAVFPVAYYHGAQRVFGRGLLSDQPPPFSVENHTSSGMPTNEWLFVTVPDPADYLLLVKQGQTQLASINLKAVGEADLADLTLGAESTDGKHDGDEVWLYARAHDTDGHQVLGVYTGWTLEGVPQVGKNNDTTQTQGDLYRYHFNGGGPMRTVAATHGSLGASVQVRADDGYVADTTYLGCTAAPGARPAPVGLALLFVLMVLGRPCRRS